MKFLSKEDMFLLKRALHYAIPHLPKYIIIFFIILFINLLDIIDPIYLGNAIQAISEKNSTIFYNSIKIIILLFLIRITFILINKIFSMHVNIQLSQTVKFDLFKNILDLNMAYIEKLGSGKLLSIIFSDSSVISNILNNQLFNIFIDSIKIILLVAAMFKINIKLSIVALISFPISYFIFFVFGKIFRKKTEKLKLISDNEFSLL